MRILGIESSSLVASVAIVEDDITMAEFTADFKKTHSQTLLPMIDDMVKLLGSSCPQWTPLRFPAARVPLRA